MPAAKQPALNKWLGSGDKYSMSKSGYIS